MTTLETFKGCEKSFILYYFLENRIQNARELDVDRELFFTKILFEKC